MASTTFAFIDGVGTPEMLLIFVLVLVLFGGQKLPEFARGLGKSIREFKKAAAGVEEEFRKALDEDERKQNTPALPVAQATPATNSSSTTPVTDPYVDPYASPDEYDSSRYDATVEAGPGTATVSPPAADSTAKPTESAPAAAAAANPPPATAPTPSAPAAPSPAATSSETPKTS
jgi:sec-independent protein translocase protein TatA